MRIFVLKQGQNLQSLTKGIGKSAAVEAAMKRLRALNPHVDWKRLEPGTVLLLPEGMGSGDAITDSTLAGLERVVRDGLERSSARARGGMNTIEERRKEVTAVFKSAAFKKAAGGTPALKEQMASVNAEFETVRARVKQTDEALAALEDRVAKGFAALSKLLE